MKTLTEQEASRIALSFNGDPKKKSFTFGDLVKVRGEKVRFIYVCEGEGTALLTGTNGRGEYLAKIEELEGV